MRGEIFAGGEDSETEFLNPHENPFGYAKKLMWRLLKKAEHKMAWLELKDSSSLYQTRIQAIMQGQNHKGKQKLCRSSGYQRS